MSRLYFKMMTPESPREDELKEEKTENRQLGKILKSSNDTESFKRRLQKWEQKKYLRNIFETELTTVLPNHCGISQSDAYG